MDLADLRRLVVTAVAADDMLVEKLVLKGGNALELIHRIGHRASLDLDYSMDGDFDDLEGVKSRLLGSLRERFDAAGYVVFDETFGPRPPTGSESGAQWGGYRAEFKVISRQRHRELNGNLDSIRRESVPLGPDQKRTFKIDISKHEYCEGRQEVEVEAYTCFVYTPEMIAAENESFIGRDGPPSSTPFLGRYASSTTTSISSWPRRTVYKSFGCHRLQVSLNLGLGILFVR